jgi:archaellum component FlaC
LTGTEFGLFISINGGMKWIRPGGNLPRVPIDDIIINARDNDIILGTHGRGIIILDDIAFIEKLDQKVLDSDVYLFPPRTSTQYYEKGSLPQPGASEFSGPNPDYGVLITYYLRSDPENVEKSQVKQGPGEQEVDIVILDKDGKVVRELRGPDREGFNRISWDLRYPLLFDVGYVEGSWYGPFWGPFALPGEYTVKLLARGQQLVRTVQIRVDPQAKTTVDQLKARFEASMSVNDLNRAFKEGQKAVGEIDKELNRVKELLKKQKSVPDEVNNRMRECYSKFDEIKKEFTGGQTPNFAIIEMAGQLQASFTKPTQSQLRSISQLTDRVSDNIEKLNNILSQEYSNLQILLIDNGIYAVPPGPIRPPKRNWLAEY